MKILLFANTDWYLYNFRRALAEKLRADGHEVVLVAPPGAYGEKLRALGFRWEPLPFSTRSTNPLGELALVGKLVALYRRERPDLVHHFTIKCVLYGSIAAKRVGGIKIINAVTGLGHVFTDPGWQARLMRPLVRGLYRLALRGDRVRVIFQNSDDRDSFVQWGLVDASRTRLIRGSGVDTSKFTGRGTRDAETQKQITNHQSRVTNHESRITNHASRITSHASRITLLFASRLLREKGICELVDAFTQVRQRHPGCRLRIAGDLYPENPSSLTPRDVDAMKQVDGITFLGHVDAMQAELDGCDIVVLPSYREGTPRILIEAAAMEKPIVATDIAGCRGLVVDGENGFLVPVKSVEPMAEAIEKLVVDRELRERFGKKGRDIVLAEFDERIVIERTLAVYAMLNRNPVNGE